MKRMYTVLIALSSMVLGFALSSYMAVPFPLPTSLNFNSPQSIVRITKGSKVSNDNYYVNVLSYGVDSNTITSLDSFNTKLGLTIAYNGSSYLLTAQHNGIDTIPRTVFQQTNITLVDSTIYSRFGVIYGNDKSGKLQSIPIGNIVQVQGGQGTVTYGQVPIDFYE